MTPPGEAGAAGVAGLTHASSAVLVLPADADEDEPLLAVSGGGSGLAT